jgi:hypothetical protein
MKKQPQTQKAKLDLHHLTLKNGQTPQETVERLVDQFLTKYLLCDSVKLEIVVGRGIGSTRFIDGKNPIRHYVENYLTKMNCPFRSGDVMFGQDGVIFVEW